MAYTVFDNVEVRCPELGGEVTFGYCRTLRDGMPCARALVCFELKFPVAEYFRRVLKEDTFREVFSAESGRKTDRMQRLIVEIDRARRRIQFPPPRT